jgi:hypothetical protein
MTLHDAEAVFAYTSDGEVMRYMNFAAYRTIGDTRAFLGSVIAGYAHDRHVRGMVLRADGEEEEVAVAPLFGSPEAAQAFRDGAPHLRLPGSLGRIEDPDGLRRHALVAREAGARYAVLDPGPGPAEAVPLEDLIR